MRRRDHGEGPPLPPLQPLELGALARLNGILIVAGLVAKSAVLLGFFLWARNSPAGDAALKGVVFADVISWVLFSFLDLQFRRLQIGIGAIFEAVVLIVFLQRGALLDIPAAPEAMIVTIGFFFLYVLGKCAVWGAQRAIEVTGVKESA